MATVFGLINDMNEPRGYQELIRLWCHVLLSSLTIRNTFISVRNPFFDTSIHFQFQLLFQQICNTFCKRSFIQLQNSSNPNLKKVIHF